jgi:hypothetical protein
MVAAVAAAAVVAKNVRLFIVTSLDMLRNLVNADQDSELPPGFVFKLGDCRSDVGNVAPTEFAEEPRRTGYVPDTAHAP